MVAILIICGAMSVLTSCTSDNADNPTSMPALTSCSNDDDPTGRQDEYAGVPLVILDTDIGSSTDDLFALEMLYRYEDDEEEDEPDTPVAEGWTWDAAKHTFTWQGTPAATVEMLAVGDVNLESVQIQFTID